MKKVEEKLTQNLIDITENVTLLVRELREKEKTIKSNIKYITNLEQEKERLKKQIEQQTTLIEYLKENNLESKGE